MSTILPLISCITPTANRPKFLEQAIECFKAQEYPNKEMVILDDGKVPTYDVPIGSECIINVNPLIRYTYSSKRQCIARKRNLLCSDAKGTIIAHFDDDDWSSSERLARQVISILGGCLVTGFKSALFYDHISKSVFKWVGTPTFIVGATLMYTKDIWQTIRFNELQLIGSDNTFVSRSKHLSKSIEEGEKMFVAHNWKGSSNVRDFRYGYSKQLDSVLPNGFLASLKALKAGTEVSDG